MDSMKHGRYQEARTLLETLLNTYPDSEYLARAKLAVGDSWYNEGGSAAWQQAEVEYKDFQTFYPNLPEASEAQLQVAEDPIIARWRSRTAITPRPCVQPMNISR